MNSKPILCYVTDRRALSLAAGEESPSQQSAALFAVMRNAIAAGVDWIQIREKDLPARELLGLVREAVVAAAGTATKILVNDRLDVALAAGAAGVHLGHESFPVAAVKQWCGARANLGAGGTRLEPAAGQGQGLRALCVPDDFAGSRAGMGERNEEASAREVSQVPVSPAGFLVGASCHSLEEARAAERDAADYIIFGPVFATPSKAAYAPPLGLAKLEEVCRSVRIPALAIGGITLENAASCLAAGAAGLAAIRLFQLSSDLPALLHGLRSAR